MLSHTHRAVGISCDVTNEESIAVAIKSLEAADFSANILVNNAGITMVRCSTYDVMHAMSRMASVKIVEAAGFFWPDTGD